eukprot:4363742-Pyramimonas_sp.AAC.2
MTRNFALETVNCCTKRRRMASVVVSIVYVDLPLDGFGFDAVISCAGRGRMVRLRADRYSAKVRTTRGIAQKLCTLRANRRHKIPPALWA